MTENERVAVLETQHEQLRAELHEMRQDIKEIRRAVTSWRGVIAGVVLTVSIVWAGATYMYDVIRHKVGS